MHLIPKKNLKMEVIPERQNLYFLFSRRVGDVIAGDY